MIKKNDVYIIYVIVRLTNNGKFKTKILITITRILNRFFQSNYGNLRQQKSNV